MRKSEILIEQGALGMVRRVEVAMDVPVSLVLPQLVKKLQLPPTDLFGTTLPYRLSVVPDGRPIAESMSLEAAGVLPGMRLQLDSAVTVAEEPVAATILRMSTQSPITVSANQQPADPQLHGSETMSDQRQFASDSLPPRVQQWQRTASHKRSRRAFLLAAGAVISVGGLGVGYAVLRSVTAQKSSPQPVAKQKTMPKQPMIVKPGALPGLTFKQHRQLVRAVSWSPNGQFLASGADDSRMLVWDQKGNILQDSQHPGPVRAVSWSPDGQRLVTCANTQVAFYQALTGTRLFHSQHNHDQTIAVVAWSPGGSMHVISAGADQRAILWNPTNYQAVLTYRMHHAAITAATWSADGQTVATSSSGGLIHVWNAMNGQDLHGVYQDGGSPWRAIAFAPVGSLLAAGADDGMVRIWNGLNCTMNGTQCQDQPQRLTITKSAMRAIAWSPDARFLMVGANDGTVKLFQVAQKAQLLFTLQLHTNVRSINWSPDGKQVAIAYGNQVTLWKLQGL